MKMPIRKLFVRISIAAALTAVLITGAAAQPGVAEQSRDSRRQIIEELVSHDKIAALGKTAVHPASPLNRLSFRIAAEFAVAAVDAAHLDTDEAAAKSVIVDLAYLIDSLENQPEAAAVQNLLKTVVRGTTTAQQAQRELENAFRTYTNRQADEQKWHLHSGMTLTKLIFSTYVGDNEAIKINLQGVAKLIKSAPPNASPETLARLKMLAEYAARQDFSTGDYAVIFENAKNAYENFNA